jgi:hypothetical protein
MNDPVVEMKDRLKAAELLGKSQADFTEKLEHTGADGQPISFTNLTDEQLDAKIQAMLPKSNGAGSE